MALIIVSFTKQSKITTTVALDGTVLDQSEEPISLGWRA